MGVSGRDIVDAIAMAEIRGVILVFSNSHLILVLLEDGKRVREVE